MLLETPLPTFYPRHRTTAVAASGTIAIAVLAMIGWLTDLPLLTSYIPTASTIKFNAAVSLLALAALLLARTGNGHMAARRVIGAASFATAAFFGAATLAEHLLGVGLGIDQLFVRDNDGTAFPGRMAPLTAFAILALAFATIAIRTKHRPFARIARGILALTTAITVFVLLGFAYGVNGYYGANHHAWMALPTAIAVLLLSVGGAAAKSHEGWYWILFTADTPPARVSRRIIVIATVTLSVLGWVRLTAQRAGLFPLDLGVELLVTIQIAVASVLVIWGARLLDAEFRTRLAREHDLSLSNERYRLVTRATEDATYDWDLVTSRRYWNEAAQERHNVPAIDNGRVDGTWLERLHPEDRGRVGSSFAAALAGADTWWTGEYRALGTDGWIEVLERCFIVRDAAGRAIRAVAALTNVGPLREAERVLRTSHDELERLVDHRTADLNATNQRLAGEVARRKGIELVLRHERDFTNAVMNTSAALMIVLDADGLIVRFNRACEALTGRTEKEMAGRPLDELLLTDEDRAEVHERFTTLHQRNSQSHHENDWTAIDGVCRRIAWVNSAIRDERGFVSFIISTGIDITEERETQRALLASRDELASTAEALRSTNEELESFSYSVSHDLRAPLRAIAGFSQALAEDYGETLPAEAVDYLARIRNATRRMTDLIDGLLALSRTSRAELVVEDVNLSTMVEDMTTRLQELHPERTVTVDIEPDVRAHGDPRLLRVVLDNLLQNAWKFSAKAPAASVRFGVRAAGAERQYFVSDNGAGFDGAYANRLFVPFQRLHRASEFPGTGIGLATVRRVITRHGGKVGVQAAPGEGATFFFTLGDRDER